MSAIAALPVDNCLCEIADMQGQADQAEAESNPLYRRLMAIKPEDMTLNAWALAAGVSRTFFNDVRKRGNANHDSIRKVVAAAGIAMADFEAANGLVQTEVRAASLGDVRRDWRGPDKLPDLPVYGAAMGGEYGDIDQHIELIELHLSDVLYYIARSPSLVGKEDYGLEIVGDSMAPRFKPGERVGVAPRASIAIGDDVIVQLRARDGDDERIVKVLIKELVRRTATHVELKQHNPEATFRVPIEEVAAMHKVRGHHL